MKSIQHDIKIQAISHNANSKCCPVFQKVIERIKRKTCYDAKKLPGKLTSSVSMISLNCRSLCSKVHQVMEIVEQTDIYEICL